MHKLFTRSLLCSAFAVTSATVLQGCGRSGAVPGLGTPVAQPVVPAPKKNPVLSPAPSRSQSSEGGSPDSSASSGGSGGGGWGSDRRLKTEIRLVGTSPAGIPVYVFRYVWGGPVMVGTMAQDLLAIRPEAVTAMPSGYFMVDYDMLDVAMVALTVGEANSTAKNIVARAVEAAALSRCRPPRAASGIRQPAV